MDFILVDFSFSFFSLILLSNCFEDGLKLVHKFGLFLQHPIILVCIGSHTISLVDSLSIVSDHESVIVDLILHLYSLGFIFMVFFFELIDL